MVGDQEQAYLDDARGGLSLLVGTQDGIDEGQMGHAGDEAWRRRRLGGRIAHVTKRTERDPDVLVVLVHSDVGGHEGDKHVSALSV